MTEEGKRGEKREEKRGKRKKEKGKRKKGRRKSFHRPEGLMVIHVLAQAQRGRNRKHRVKSAYVHSVPVKGAFPDRARLRGPQKPENWPSRPRNDGLLGLVPKPFLLSHATL